MKKLIATAALCAASLAGAQTLTGLTVEPGTAQVGHEVKLTATFDVANDNTNCNVRIRWGDGAERHFHVNQAKDVPLVLTHSYAQPGSYEVKVAPKNNLPQLKCLGKEQKAGVVITPAVPVAAAAPKAAAAAHCPDGWKLVKGSARKNGAYTCSAKAGTPLPKEQATCPGDLTFFANAKKSQFGCRP